MGEGRGSKARPGRLEVGPEYLRKLEGSQKKKVYVGIGSVGDEHHELKNRGSRLEARG